tara:strand:+ start:548 stop:856 length:309 start_codon:yes stop_codon:yes gene_type:complete
MAERFYPSHIKKAHIKDVFIFKNIRYPKIPLSPYDLYITTHLGDRLDLLADQFYDDVDYWWIISAANIGVIRRDSYILQPGIEIRIPQSIDRLYQIMKNLNS